MRVASDQPTFMPWAGFWHKALSVDVLISSESVPVSYGSKDHYHNRVLFNGSWLTLPIHGDTRSGLFSNITFDPIGLKKIVKTLRFGIGKKYPHAGRIEWLCRAIEQYNGPYLLADFNRYMIHQMAFAMHTVVDIMVDDVVPNQTQSKTERLIERVRRVTGKPVDYYMGRGALAYMDMYMMQSAGFTIYLQTFPQGVADGTILQLIAQEPHPAITLRDLGTWEQVGRLYR